MILLTVRERDRLPVGGADGLDPSVLDLLVRLLPRLPPKAVTLEHRAIRFGPFCGVLRLGRLVIEVLPKVALDTDTARGTMTAMLRTVGDLSPARTDRVGLGTRAPHLLDLFILDFCTSVQERLRRGALRRYEMREESLGTVRGRIHFAETVRRHPFDRSRLMCRHDELSPDHAHNRALKFVLRRLLGHCLGGDAKMAVNGLLLRMEEIGDQSCTASDIERLGFDRLTRAWQPIFERAAWLLRGLFPDLCAGRLEAMGLLCDMERLFERFVGVVLRRAWSGSGMEVTLQGPYRHFAHTESGTAFGMRPDSAVLAPDGRILLIVDAKWKQLSKSPANAGVSRNDIYQMAAYAARYGCHDLALVFPREPTYAQGLVEQFMFPQAPETRVCAYVLDIAALARGQALPEALRPPDLTFLSAQEHAPTSHGWNGTPLDAA